MKPKLEDVLLLNACFDNEIVDQGLPSKIKFRQNVYCAEKYCKNLEKLHNEKFSDEDIKKMIVYDLKGQYFPGYVKYFHSNYTDFSNRSMKDSQKSTDARLKSNRLLTKNVHSAQAHEEIWKLCCKSIALAPVGSKELVLGYECRSNLLLHLKKYAECVKDIDRAVAITEFHPLKVKLLCRKMTCFVAMNKDVDEKENLWLTLKCHFENTDGALKDETFLKMFKQAKNDSMRQARDNSNGITEKDKKYTLPLTSHSNVDYMFNKGKHILVANQDFDPGDAVVVEKPILVTSVNTETFYAYCTHCLSFMWAGVPCDECSLCMYCSEKCKAEAWEKYHYLECKVLPHINFDDKIYYKFQGSIRLFVIGLKEFRSISKLKEQILNIETLKDDSKSFKNIKWFDSDFLNIYVSPIQPIFKSETNLMKRYVRHACFLMAYIIQTCDIFGKDVKLIKGKQLAKDKNFVDLGFVMLKLLLCMQNTLRPTQIYLQESECPRQEKCNERCCLKGDIFDTLRGSFEYSCNPNTVVCWTDDGKLIYYCVQPIKRTEKLTFSHTEFYRKTLCQRDISYCRECTACLKKWPLMSAMYKKYEHRRTKLKSGVTELVQKYLEKNGLKTASVEEENCVFTFEELQQLKADVNNIVKVCGQPSFPSSFLISFLCKTFEKFYGTIPLQSHLPAQC